MNIDELIKYVVTQLRAGIPPNDIASQLRIANWPEDAIIAAFSEANQQLAPISQPQTQTQPQILDTTQSQSQDIVEIDKSIVESIYQESSKNETKPLVLPVSNGLGKIKTGWLLMKQCFGIIKNNPSLWRYMIMVIVWELILTIVYVSVVVYDATGSHIMFKISEDGSKFNALGFVFAISLGYILTTVIYFYITALSAHVLSIFRGQQTTYKQSLSIAIKKLPSILMFSAISTLVGYILRAIEKRSKIIGSIISSILGLLWSLATTFSLPIIADSENKSNHPIKDSVMIFKKAWGETVSSRAVVGGIILLIYVLIMIPCLVTFLVLFGEVIGITGIFVTIVVFFIGVVMLCTLQALATNILNVALYYYAQYGVIPPSFSEDLLSSALISK